MFPDSEIAKQFSCKRTKASYVVSDGLGPYFRELVMDELNTPNVFYSTAIDETPFPEQCCQQLDAIVRYFSCITKHVVVEHLQSFRLASAVAEPSLKPFSEKQGRQHRIFHRATSFVFSDVPDVMKAVKKKELHLIDVLPPHAMAQKLRQQSWTYTTFSKVLYEMLQPRKKCFRCQAMLSYVV